MFLSFPKPDHIDNKEELWLASSLGLWTVCKKNSSAQVLLH